MPPKKSAASKNLKPATSKKAAKATKATKSTKATKATQSAESKKEIKADDESKENKDEKIVDASVCQPLTIKESTIEKAVSALSKWNKEKSESSSKKDLFEDDDNDIPVYLQVTSKKFMADSKLIKPRMLQLPHPIYDLDDVRVCIFVKDDLFDEESLAKIEILKEDKLKNLASIVTVKDLKTKYHPYEARRRLLSEFDVFLTDASVANMIPKLLGKIFFGSPKFPLTITITNDKKLSIDKLISSFNMALNSVGYMLPMGTNMSFKLGMLGQDIGNLKENIVAIAKFLEKFPIRVLQLKLKSSPSLPIYVTDKVYSENDIIDPTESTEQPNKKSSEDIELSMYAEGLKELGIDEEEAKLIFGKKRLAPKSDESSAKKSKH